MKPMIRPALGMVFLSALINTSFCADPPEPGFIDFGKFAPSASGREYVEVNLTTNLIAMAAQLSEKGQPEVADVLRGLRSVRVNVIGLDDGNRAEVQTRVKAIRADLEAAGWERVVSVQEKSQDVGIYLKTRGGDAVQGLVVTVLDGKKEAVLVNIVGNIKTDQLALLGERFNIDPLKKIAREQKKK